MKTKFIFFSALPILLSLFLLSCKDDEDGDPMPNVKDPDTAMKATIDRFSAAAATLMVRTSTNGLPDAGMPINFDSGEPFITTGLGPGGEVVEYYNFDVQPLVPAPIFVFMHENGNFVNGQLNIINEIPGDAGYNDFWRVNIVTVPNNYVANTISSTGEIQTGGFNIAQMDLIVNCPVVPEGSTAAKRLNGEDASLVRGWYKDQVVFYFNFSEKELMATGSGMVPVSPIYVTFNINPNEEGGGPASGFVTEEDMVQTHNVVATLPANSTYSPLWSVNAYDNIDFDDVMDLATAASANILGMDVASVNCPVVSIQ